MVVEKGEEIAKMCASREVLYFLGLARGSHRVMRTLVLGEKVKRIVFTTVTNAGSNTGVKNFGIQPNGE